MCSDFSCGCVLTSHVDVWVTSLVDVWVTLFRREDRECLYVHSFYSVPATELRNFYYLL